MKNMKKSIVIGSLLAALLMISIPFASAIQMQPLSEEIKNNPSEQHIYTSSDKEIEELIIAIQEVIDYLESIGYEGEVIQKLQYFINNVYDFGDNPLLCLSLLYLIWYLTMLIKRLIERGGFEGLVVILGGILVSIVLMYGNRCRRAEDDFLYSLNDILEGGNSDASCGCESMEPEGFNNQNSQSQQSNPQQIILRGLPNNN